MKNRKTTKLLKSIKPQHYCLYSSPTFILILPPKTKNWPWVDPPSSPGFDKSCPRDWGSFPEFLLAHRPRGQAVQGRGESVSGPPHRSRGTGIALLCAQTERWVKTIMGGYDVLWTLPFLSFPFLFSFFSLLKLKGGRESSVGLFRNYSGFVFGVFILGFFIVQTDIYFCGHFFFSFFFPSFYSTLLSLYAPFTVLGVSVTENIQDNDKERHIYSYVLFLFPWYPHVF